MNYTYYIIISLKYVGKKVYFYILTGESIVIYMLLIYEIYFKGIIFDFY